MIIWAEQSEEAGEECSWGVGRHLQGLQLVSQGQRGSFSCSSCSMQVGLLWHLAACRWYSIAAQLCHPHPPSCHIICDLPADIRCYQSGGLCLGLLRNEDPHNICLGAAAEKALTLRSNHLTSLTVPKHESVFDGHSKQMLLLVSCKHRTACSIITNPRIHSSRIWKGPDK